MSVATGIPEAPAPAPRTAVVLLSGGLDSATCLALARRWGWAVHALSFDYGQRHRVELGLARRLARRWGALSHRVARMPFLAEIGGSALTDRRLAVPRNALGSKPIPSTYVPARNTIFLSAAAALAEVTGATEVVIGANALDYSGYPDCRPAYLRAFEKVARLGTKAGDEGRALTIRAPLLRMSKARIVALALALGVDPAATSSCYAPGASGEPCGRCDACLLRAKGFAEAGARDARLRRPTTKRARGRA